MSKAYLGTMQVAYPIESISRKLALRSEKCVTKSIEHGSETHVVKIPGKMFMGGMVRSNPIVTGNGQETVIKTQYLFIRKNARHTPVSADEIEQRSIFSRVTKSVPVLLRNLSQITNIQMKYVEGKDDNSKTLNGISVKGYDFRGWVFAVQYAGLKNDSGYDLTKFPSTWDA